MSTDSPEPSDGQVPPDGADSVAPAPAGMSFPKRLAFLSAGFIVAVGLISFWAAGFLRTMPPTVAASTVSNAQGKQAYITLQTVGSVGFGARPSWVSYLIRNSAGKWVHTTKFTVPAHATVHVTIEQFDSAGALRNPLWAKVQGTLGGVETVSGKVGNKTVTRRTYSQLGNEDVAHTFAIPALGIFVPLAGLPGNATLCAVAPCKLSSAHDTMQFSFKTGNPGIVRWQCFVPCGLGFLDGNGGPMQTLGYMMGFMQVQA